MTKDFGFVRVVEGASMSMNLREMMTLFVLIIGCTMRHEDLHWGVDGLDDSLD